MKLSPGETTSAGWSALDPSNTAKGPVLDMPPGNCEILLSKVLNWGSDPHITPVTAMKPMSGRESAPNCGGQRALGEGNHDRQRIWQGVPRQVFGTLRLTFHDGKDDTVLCLSPDAVPEAPLGQKVVKAAKFSAA